MDTKTFIKKLEEAGRTAALVQLYECYSSAKDNLTTECTKSVMLFNSLFKEIVGGHVINHMYCPDFYFEYAVSDEEFFNTLADYAELNGKLEYVDYFRELATKNDDMEIGELYSTFYKCKFPVIQALPPNESHIDGYLSADEELAITKWLEDDEVQIVEEIIKNYKAL